MERETQIRELKSIDEFEKQLELQMSCTRVKRKGLLALGE